MSLRQMLRLALVPRKGSTRARLIPRISPGDAIPRVIHQVFFKTPAGPPPVEIQENIARLRRLNPQWSHRLYDEPAMLQFIRDNYPRSILEHFLRIDPVYGAARADLFRYLLLYRVGGVYLDIKSSLSRPLDMVIAPTDRYLLSFWRNRPGEQFEGWGLYPELGASGRGEFQQWHIVAAAGHPFLRAVIRRVLKNLALYNPVLDGTGWEGVMHTTGPIAYTLAILPQLHRHAHRFVDSLDELGFQYSIYTHTSRHQSLFSAHYAARSEPIVQLGGADRAVSRVFRFLQASRGRDQGRTCAASVAQRSEAPP